MSTYTQIIYQIVFSTKYREPVLHKKGRRELFNYIKGIITKKGCKIYEINGVEDHIHILTHLHQSIALASLVKDIKVASSMYIKEKNLFKGFLSWQLGYGAFTYNVREKEKLVNYVRKQEVHHARKSSADELIELLAENGVEYDERFLE